MTVQHPDPVLTLTAAELVEKIRGHGGRLYRTRSAPSVYVLTTSGPLAARLLQLGARPQAGTSDDGSYKRTRNGPREWDLWVHTIKCAGEETLWEACA